MRRVEATPGGAHDSGAEGAADLVLVVDDEPGIARLVILTLEEAGFRVQHAPDGVSAIEAAEASLPDAVVLDLQLPDINGREVFHRLRALGIEAPVLIISAYGARRAQREIGADAAIEKPFDPLTVRRRVERLLGRN